MAIHPAHSSLAPQSDALPRIAVLVDCDNMPADSLRFALRAMAQFGRIVVRRGYGNHATLTAKWRESLVEYAFTPHLQFQYAAGKNTADIAMAIDAVELMFDDRADAYCLVTSDSDFSYLCRRLRERGSNVYIVGERRTPQALRNASDQFFELELLRQEYADPPVASALPDGTTPAPSKAALLEQRAAEIIAGLALLAEESDDGWVSLTALNSYIRRTDPGFDTKRYGFKRFLDMVHAQPKLETRLIGSVWLVRARQGEPAPVVAAAPAPAPVVVDVPAEAAVKGEKTEPSERSESRSRRSKGRRGEGRAEVKEEVVTVAATAPEPVPVVAETVVAATPVTSLSPAARRRGRERLKALSEGKALESSPPASHQAPVKAAAKPAPKPATAPAAKQPASRRRKSNAADKQGAGEA